MNRCRQETQTVAVSLEGDFLENSFRNVGHPLPPFDRYKTIFVSSTNCSETWSAIHERVLLTQQKVLLGLFAWKIQLFYVSVPFIMWSSYVSSMHQWIQYSLPFFMFFCICDTDSIASFNMHRFISPSFINIIYPLRITWRVFFFKWWKSRSLFKAVIQISALVVHFWSRIHEVSTSVHSYRSHWFFYLCFKWLYVPTLRSNQHIRNMVSIHTQWSTLCNILFCWF